MRCFFLASLIVIVCAARVNFPYSEVLQAPDLNAQNYASFECPDGCTVYVDMESGFMFITREGTTVCSFTDIIGGSTWTPKGVKLEPGEYRVENRGLYQDFVLYVLRAGAPNTGTGVYTPQKSIGVGINGPARYATLLSSFDALWFYTIAGAFPAGYPRIYTTGFDAVSDGSCQPVFQARNQFNAENSWPVIRSPIFTVDFGYVGVHNISVNQRDGDDMIRNAAGSTVYTSPGYIGCSYNRYQAYYAKATQVHDQFAITADSLNFEASGSLYGPDERVRMSINYMPFDLMGENAKIGVDFQHRDTYDFKIDWVRSNTSSNWRVQLDYGLVRSTASTPRPQVTTSGVRGFQVPLSVCIMLVGILMF